MLLIQRQGSLSALDLFRSQVADKPEIIEAEIAPGIVCFSVMKGIGNSDTYNTPWTREARGITFRTDTGEIASRPFHKFFNVNERETTQLDKLDWNRVTRVMDKRDGSMIHPVPIKDKGIIFKSKKVFDSDVAVTANRLMLTGEFFTFCNQLLLDYNSTPIFELTSPNHRIVLGYEKPELKLLHIRYNDTGQYWSLDSMSKWAHQFGIETVDEVTEFNSFAEMVEAAKTRENTEGWVVQFDDGEMVKVKTEWYMRRHRAMTYFRERDIALLIMSEELDDVKAMLAGDGIDITAIEDVERKFAGLMKNLIDSVRIKYETVQHTTPRNAAATYMGDEHFGLVMALMNKKEPKYLDFFKTKILKQEFGLETMGVLMGLNGDENENG